MTLTTIEPEEAERLIASGAKLIDIRDADEHARECTAGAANQPLARIEQFAPQSGSVIFHCRTGMRTQNNAERLAAASGSSPCYVLAGGLVLLGIVFGFLVSPLFSGLSAFVGAGLMMAGASG